MNKQEITPVPGIPLAALDAVSDPNVRDVLRALVEGHHVRNGQAGNGDNRFVTAAELGQMASRGKLGPGGAGASSGAGGIMQPDVARIVNELVAQVLGLALFRQLGERIALLEAPLGTVDILRKNMIDAANKALAEFDTEAAQLGEGVTELTRIFDGSIKQTRAIKQTLYSAEGALPLATAAILDINEISVTSKSANARSLAGLTAQLNDPATGLQASRSDYVKQIAAEAGQRVALAEMAEVLRAQVNDPATGLVASRADYVNRISLEAKQRSIVASQVNGLAAALIDPSTGMPLSDALIAENRQIDLTNLTALAKEDQIVYAALGTKNSTFFSTSAPPRIAAVGGVPFVPASPGVPAKPAVAPQEASPVSGDIWYDTSNNNRPRRWDGAAWVDTSDTRAAAAAGLVSNEAAARVSQDNVLVTAINTVWSAIGGSSGLIHGGEKVTVNTAGATAESFKQVQAALRDSGGALISAAAIKHTTEVLLNKAGQVDSKWVVNIDSGGAATGFRQAGFGLSGSQAENGPSYAFGVRADTFWIASPGEAGRESAPMAQVPFIVKTNSWTDGQGITQLPGVYLNELFATSAKIGAAQIRGAHIGEAEIGRAHIGLAEIDTLRIRGNAVTVSKVASRTDDAYGSGRQFLNILSTTVTMHEAGTVMAIVTCSQAPRRRQLVEHAARHRRRGSGQRWRRLPARCRGAVRRALPRGRHPRYHAEPPERPQMLGDQP